MKLASPPDECVQGEAAGGDNRKPQKAECAGERGLSKMAGSEQRNHAAT